MIYIIFDHVDGIIAREKNLGSKFGGWLDGIVGFITAIAMFLSLGLGIRSEASLFWGGLAAVAFPTHFLFIFYYKNTFTENPNIIQKRKFGFIKRSYGTVVSFPIVFVAILLNKALWSLIFLGFFGNLFWMLVLLLQIKAARRN